MNRIWTVADLIAELSKFDPAATISVIGDVGRGLRLERVDVSDDGTFVSIQVKQYECGYARGMTWRQALHADETASE